MEDRHVVAVVAARSVTANLAVAADVDGTAGVALDEPRSSPTRRRSAFLRDIQRKLDRDLGRGGERQRARL
ncbi:MAG: hypothetical protein M0004_04460 [Actinomycetota bacterium]|nr:hypothetical protein [Actinomycetota bacterium]